MGRIRVSSVNVNGIRAAARKGMLDWLDSADVDILTLQEVRAPVEELVKALPGWHIVEDEATAKGRAGVAVASRVPAAAVRTEIAVPGDRDDVDMKGRWIEADFTLGADTITIASAYVFTGEADAPRQEHKWAFLDAIEQRLPQLSADGALALVTGDLNVAHRELDIRNWRGNLKKAGFLPRERAYFDRFFGPADAPVVALDGSQGTGLGWVDVGRAFHGDIDGPYTWWSNRGKAFDTDTGWRIDYHLASPALAERVTAYTVTRAPSWDSRWSDHAPVTVDYTVG